MVSEFAETPTILPRLPQSLAAQLFASASSHQLKAGEALFVRGAPGDGCYRLEQGLLKVVITSPRGEERILAILGPGSIAGELALIDGQSRSASVFAIRDCELRFVRRSAFEECTVQYPDIYRYLVNVLAARLRETNETLAAAILTVEARLARALLDLAQYFRGHQDAEQIVIDHKMTQNDLAAIAGIARENVSRVLTDWKERNIVVRSSGFYRLYDIAALKQKARA